MSREAAEQVLAVVAARVEGMGGVKGWRQKEREKREGFLGGGGGWGWGEEGVGRNVEDEGGGDERDDRETEENERKKSLEEEDDNEEVLSLHPHSPIQTNPSTDPKPFKKKTRPLQ